MKTLSLLFLLLIFTAYAEAQQNTKPSQKWVLPKSRITGRVIDSASKQPIAYATVALRRADNNKITDGASANGKGIFVMDSVPNGTYTATFDFIGYKRFVKKGIIVSDKNRKILLGDVILKANNQLGTVNISHQKPVIMNEADRIVFNVDKDVTSQGGVATDVLKKIPQVSVDIDGNVEVEGDGNVLFLINGKPSTIFGNNLADVLQSIPASQIEKIEVITAPGAKYDADGTGGIINIILKKSKVEGINGNIAGSAGTRLENGSFNLNGRKGNFGGHAWFSANTALRSTTLSSRNSKTESTSGDTINTLAQNGQSQYIRGGYQSGIGFDWDITPKNSLSLSLGYNGFSHDGSGSTDQLTTTEGNLGNILQSMSSVLNNTNNFGSKVLDYSLYYKKLFDKEKQQFTFLYFSSNSNNNSFYDQTQNSANNDTVHSGTQGNNLGTDRETRISADYTQPVTKDITIQTGAKAVLSDITSSTDVYILNPQDNDYLYNSFQSNALTYNRNVYAAYLSGSFLLWDSINARAGLRYERTVTNANFGTGETVNIPDYNTLAPSFVASKDIGHGQTLKIAYNHRIERPSYRVLNPFINAADPRNMTTGNPNLEPEIGDKIEIGYNKSFDKGGNLNVALFYKENTHEIMPYITFYPDFPVGDSDYTNVNLTDYANVGKEQKTGLSISGSVPFTKKLNMRGNIMIFDRHIINEVVPGDNSNGIDYRIKLNATYQFDSNFVAEAYGNFRSPVSSLQGKTPSWSSYSITFRRIILHKKGSIGLTATDPFNEYVNLPATLTGPNFEITSTRKVPYRSFGVSFTYKFGKLNFKKDNSDEENNDNSDED